MTIQQLTFDGDNYLPSWSPDGRWIVYDSDIQETPRGFAIWNMRSDGTSKTVLCEGRAADWLQTKDRIVADREMSSGFDDIVTFNDSGNNLTQLTSNNKFNRYPKYSPDGEKIIYCSFYDHPYAEIQNGTVWIVSINGRKIIQLTRGVSSE